MMNVSLEHDCGERLTHYGKKCRQHLSRVWLSHGLASAGLKVLGTEQSSFEDQVLEAFEEVDSNERQRKLQRGLHEVHLIALKAEFELYLNRVLTVLWRAHFSALAKNAPKKTVSMRRLAEATLHESGSRDLAIQMLVPSHGLDRFVEAIKVATKIRLPADLKGFDFARWSQIEVALQVRHLLEHRDGRVDSQFRTEVQHFWDKTSWGSRDRLPNVKQRIALEQTDVEHTYLAMREACRGLTDSLLQWHLRQLQMPTRGE